MLSMKAISIDNVSCGHNQKEAAPCKLWISGVGDISGRSGEKHSCGRQSVTGGSCRWYCGSFLSQRSSPAQLVIGAMAHAASGMRVSDECKLKFMELKRKKTYRYIIFKIDEKVQEITVEKTGDPGESYDAFSSCLPESDPRFGIFDLDFLSEDNRPLSKIFFIAWVPDTARVKAKMLYASSKDRCRRELDGIHYEVQATDPTEMEIEVIKEKAK